MGVQSYRITQDGVEIAKVAGNINYYTIKGLVPSRSYSIKVEAVDPSGNVTKDGLYKVMKVN